MSNVDVAADAEGKHTPGPWTVDQHFVPSICAVHSSGRPVEIAVVMKRRTTRPGDAITEQEGEANARLIAAAPDLLVACGALLNATMFKDHPKESQMVIDAIAKATGSA